MTKKQIYISFTTIPSRIKNLKSTITSLLEQNITKIKIILNIPKIYDRFKKEKLEIPKFILDEKRIIINNLNKDYGPITKLMGILEYIKKNNKEIETKNIYIITVDDDVYYQPNLVFILFSKILKFEDKGFKGCFGCMGLNIDMNAHLFIPGQLDNTKINILEGKGAVIYKYDYFNDNNFKKYILLFQKYKECKYSDNIIISNWLANKNIERFLVFDKNYNRKLIESKYSLSYGNDKFSLTKPCDLMGTNVERYKRCFSKLINLKKMYFINDFIKSYKK